MTKARFAVIAALRLTLLTAAIMIWPKMTGTHIEFHFRPAEEAGDNVNLSFKLKNLPPRYFGSSPVSLERLEGVRWKPCPNALCGTWQEDGLGLHGCPTLTCQIKRLPPGRFRLAAQSFRTRFGLRSFLTRVNLRLTQPTCTVSLNPFNTDMIFSGNLGTVVSDEFTLP